MNLLGHNFVAKQVLNKYNPLIALGADICDLVPFIKDSVLTFEEIHEGGDLVFDYCKKHNPECLDFALGMLTHSVKFGADKYNRDITNWLLKDNSTLLNKFADRIVDCSGVTVEVAKGPRMHNYLWAGVEFYLLETQPQFVNTLQLYYKNAPIEDISRLLSSVFNKDVALIKANIGRHVGKINNYPVNTKHGLIAFGKDVFSELPEGDEIDVQKALEGTNFIYTSFVNEWDGILTKVIENVKSNMRQFL